MSTLSPELKSSERQILLRKGPNLAVWGHRIQRALSLMKKSKLNLSEIAAEVGFSSGKQLSQYFKKTLGSTGAEALKAARGK